MPTILSVDATIHHDCQRRLHDDPLDRPRCCRRCPHCGNRIDHSHFPSHVEECQKSFEDLKRYIRECFG